MTDSPTDRPLDRRNLIRGGAILAGATGIAVASAAVTPTAAQAADGDNLILGQANAESNTTVLTIGGAGGAATKAALQLTNASGPSLRLTPADETLVPDDLEPGAIMNTPAGPYIGVDVGNGAETSLLATANDLNSLPAPVALPSTRLLDTRTSAGRANIVAKSSSDALDSAGRLKAGKWIDVWVFDSGEGFADAVFVNLTAVSPTANGFLFAYPPVDPRPTGSTLNFRTGVTLANGAFVQTGLRNVDFVIRIYASSTTHVLLDRTGVIVSPPNSGADLAANRAAVHNRRRIEKMRKAVSGRRTN